MANSEPPSGVQCQWFALCEERATTTERHPILGEVFICARCQAWCRKMEK